MKKLFLIILLVSLVFAEIECPPSYNEDLQIRVLDAKLRAVRGTVVSIYYQLDHTFGKGYVNTKTELTDEDGIAKLSVHNIEVDPQKVDCNLLITASYDGKNVTETVVATKHGKPINVKMPDLYAATIRVTDQFNNALEGAEVWINSEGATAEKNGYVDLHAYVGEATILVKYADGKLEETIEVEDDFVKSIGLNLYKVAINLFDENGRILEGNAIIGKSDYESSNGTIKAIRLATATPYVLIKYKNIEKEVNVNLATKTNYDVIFDLNAPEILDVKTIQSEKYTKLVVKAVDPGVYGSGIGGVFISYRSGDNVTWKEKTGFISGKDQYSVEIPIEENKIINFFVKIRDNTGNVAVLEGQYLSSSTFMPDTKGINTTTNQSINKLTAENTEEFPLLYTIGIVIILAVVIYAVYRLKFSKNRGGEAT